MFFWVTHHFPIGVRLSPPPAYRWSDSLLAGQPDEPIRCFALFETYHLLNAGFASNNMPTIITPAPPKLPPPPDDDDVVTDPREPSGREGDFTA